MPFTDQDTGADYLLVAQSKTALAAMKNLLGQCRRLAEGYLPVIKLLSGTYQGPMGPVKKPVLSISGKVRANGHDNNNGGADSEEDIPFDDDIPV